MKRLTVTAVLVAGLISLPVSVSAHKGHIRPQITRLEFTERPLKAGTSERVVIVAHDPNSWISEIQIQWEDSSQSGGVVFAHTYCLQDPDFSTPGTPAKLKIDLLFDHPGTYHVEVRAISEKRCEGGNDTRVSRTIERDVVVKDATESFSDPDDSPGPLDVIGATHSQHADETGLRTHLVHSLTFADALGADPLAGPDDYVQFAFDTDDVYGTFERILTVDADTSGGLRATMRDDAGAVIGEGIATLDGATLTVDFMKRLLGRGIQHYRWEGFTHDSSSQACAQVCEDEAPNTALYTHRL